MIIAIPKEICSGETRVAATPETVKSYIDSGVQVLVVKGAGQNACIADDDYAKAGAEITTAAKAYKSANLILKIQAPLPEEYPLLQNGQTIIADFTNAKIKDFATKNLTCFALERMPRISRAQSMDILSSQSNLAGYKAVLNAASTLNRSLPLLMTAAGTLAPAKVMILGVGVAGLQAAATAKRLGALVFASDIREETKEQAASLGVKFITSEEIAPQLAKTDILITTAQTMGKPAPRLVPSLLLKSMPKGAVIIDMATSTGGNVEGSKHNQTICKDGITIISGGNLAAELADSASLLYARNIRSFIAPILPDKGFDFSDEIYAHTCIIRNGENLIKEKK